MKKAVKQEDRQRMEHTVFMMACKRLSIQPVKGAEMFGVSRPTFWNWRAGKTKIPKKAFVRLVEMENGVSADTWERMAAVMEIADKIGKGSLKAYPKDKRGRKKQVKDQGEK